VNRSRTRTISRINEHRDLGIIRRRRSGLANRRYNCDVVCRARRPRGGCNVSLRRPLVRGKVKNCRFEVGAAGAAADN
jgi:hypothetical protein